MGVARAMQIDKVEPDSPVGGHDGPAFRLSSTWVPGIMLVIDLVAFAIAAISSFLICVTAHAAVIEYYIFSSFFIVFISVYLMRSSRMYEMGAIMRPLARSDVIIVSILSAFLLFFTMALSLKSADIYSTRWITWFLGLGIGFVCTSRVLFKLLLTRLSARSVIGRSVVVLGAGPQAKALLTRIQRERPYFTELMGVFAFGARPQTTTLEGFPVLGCEEDLIAYVREKGIDDVIIAMPWSDDGTLTRTVERLKELPINVYMSMDLAGYLLEFRPVIGQLNQLPLFEVMQRPISGWHYFLKRLEDYVLGTVFIVLAAPLMALIAIAIKIESSGPVFFMQKRLGFNNQVFEIYKFRSMYHRPDPARDFKQAERDDPRITRVGRIIRRSSLDELPQLFNVLDGSMSLVGPRPHALRHNEEYGRQIRGYFARHKVRPGITGWAQVNGLRGETEVLSKMEARVRHDVYYADNWSILFDMRILVMTVFVVLFQKNAY
jgi:Undecaprenyl-phosphate glucose phosphotransferase